jgi:NAD(P)-dependent dehydrogenase (short-subunit alcohol dehydrogenase family)
LEPHRGIGLATAKLLAERGAKVGLVSLSKEKLEMLSRKLLNSIVITTDVTKIPEIKKMIEQTQDYFGRIDILINNAGQGYDAPVKELNRHLPLHLRPGRDRPAGAMQQTIPIIRKQGVSVRTYHNFLSSFNRPS